MQADALPEWIDLQRLGPGVRTWQGEVAPAALDRLAAASLSVSPAQANVRIDTTAGQAVVSGSATCPVEVRCERCLEAMAWPIETTFEVVAVDRLTEQDDAAETAAEVEAPKGRLALHRIIEDELILGLPAVPRHDDPSCDGGQRHFGPDGEPMPKHRSGFEALAVLKGGRSDEEH
jgi:uncharacterized protein